MNEEVKALRSLDSGRAWDVVRAKTDSPLGILLKDLTQGVIDQIIESMRKYDISASRDLQQSFKSTNATVDSNGITVGITVNERNYYWKFVNKGVNGTEVNNGAPSWAGYTGLKKDYKASILEWIRHRGITATYNNYDSLAFAIMRSIKKKGKKPRPFFDDVVNDPALVDTLKRPIEVLLGRSIELVIIEPWQ